MASGKKKGEICGAENCRSRVYEEGEDGYLYCENGHRKGELVRGKDDDDYTTAPRQKSRAQKTEEVETTGRYFKGHAALDLYLKSLQLILRHQIHFLVHDQGLPSELENVIFDLWALRVLQLEDHFVAEDITSGGAYAYDSQTPTPSLYTTTSEDESEGEEIGNRKARRLGGKMKLKMTPGLLDCVALCYLGILTLRLPITPGDIITSINTKKMPYLRAIRYVPYAMRDRLPASYHAVLEPNAVIKPKRFFAAVTELERSLGKEYGIAWPKINVQVLLWRYLKELGLPLEVYDATSKLAGYLGYGMAYSDQGEGRKGRAKRGIRELPEAQLAACLVVCVKLLYPFDGHQHPKSVAEPAATILDWGEWTRQVSERSRRGSTDTGLLSEHSPSDLAEVREKDVFNMSDGQLDEYMDWYRDTFLDETRVEKGEAARDFREKLERWFPIDRADDAGRRTLNSSADGAGSSAEDPNKDQDRDTELRLVRTVHARFKTAKIIETFDHSHGKGIVRPVQRYVYYRQVKEIPETGRRFYEEVARISGLEMEMLIKAVFFAEKKAERRKKEGGTGGTEWCGDD
ncbi:hypothetical protein BCR34DRAFT_357253 [Clohesyomyces aquaticus]|uniref:RRN7-type domain-containing protein n=1 Tax=Clohesyomyces aquaticus TaxID=1231657 RepID=A0A1Y1ZIF3_9PLEO|nr:hypothetical protein BCR34DRAFT_357253 [Clohesyomyces aquaticus]